MISVGSVLVIATLIGLPAGDEPTTDTLANGLRVRLVPLAGEKRVFVILGVRAGMIAEPAGLPHLAHLTEHLVVFGLPAGSQEKSAAERWFREGRANGETLPGWMYFDLQVEPGELERALRVQAVRLARPVFTEDLLAREIPRTLVELERVESSEAFGAAKFAFSVFVQAALRGMDEVPIKQRTLTLTVKDVQRFHAATFRPDQAVLCVLGGFDAAQAGRWIGDAFGTIPKPKEAVVRPRLREDRQQLTAHWDARTRHLFLAWSTPAESAPELAADSVAAELLAGRLAVDHELARWAKMPTAMSDLEGVFLISTQVKPGADMEAVRDRLLQHVDRLTQPGGVSEGDVVMVRQRTNQALRPGGLGRVLSIVRGSQLMVRANQELQIVGKIFAHGDLNSYGARVETMTSQAVREAAVRHLTRQKAVVLRVEPSSSLKGRLREQATPTWRKQAF